MDIDHHNPILPRESRNNYDNLFLASRHCNGKKGQKWPTADQQAKGLRFLNPCKEVDYGVHIFEDPQTHLLWGATPAGVYHIRYLDLNADHLVKERRQRYEIRKLRSEPAIVSLIGSQSVMNAYEGLAALTDLVNKLIPDFPLKPRPKK